MKTNPQARRVWKLRLVTGCLAIAAVGMFDLGVIRYCRLNSGKAAAQAQMQAQQMWNGSVAGAELFLAVR